MPREEMKFQIEDAQLIYENFSGAPTPFKMEGGDRTFGVVLPKKVADAMALDGWNVKCKIPDGEDAEEYCFINVTLGYKFRPPKVVLITDTSKTFLTEDTVGMLDWADIRQVDLVAREWQWSFAGKTGTKAMLQSMYVTINEDPLDRKYSLNDIDPPR